MEIITKRLLRLLPLIFILLAVILFFHFQLDTYLSFEAIKTHKNLLLTWINKNYGFSVFVFMLVYIIIVSLSIPGPVFLTLAGGFLFGGFQATIYVVISATIGATFIFMIVQFSIGKWLAEKGSAWVVKMQKGFQENAFQYLLFLRLVPLFPFPIVNLVPGILNIKKSVFILGTFIGIIPGTFVYAMLGSGLGEAFSSGKRPNLSIIFEPQLFWPLIGLAMLSILPIAYKKFKKRKNKHHAKK